jgi:hypothetical protein
MAQRIKTNNDTIGYVADVLPIVYQTAGNITANVALAQIGVAPLAGTIVAVGLADTNGVDAVNALSLTCDVQINAGGSLFTGGAGVAPKIVGSGAGTGNAGAGIGTGRQTTLPYAAYNTTPTVAGTWVIAGILGTTNSAHCNQGDSIGVSLTIVRTASPGTEISNPAVTIWFVPDLV